MKRHRFKINDLGGDQVRIGGKEGHHAARVLRVRAGDEIVLIDGRGGEARASVESVAGDELVARIIERREAVKASGLIIASAIPKGERADWMIEKCAELGVARIVPLICERSQVNPGEGKLTRWRRMVEAAAKQSGQATLMEIDEPTLIEDVLGMEGVTLRFFGDPLGRRSIVDAIGDLRPATGWIFFIGPEGGFSEGETGQINAAGVEGVRLGGSILRIETAAVAVAAIVNMYTGGVPTSSATVRK